MIVVSGFSGAGKGTVMKELTGRYEQYALSVSATTRDARPGEVEGRDYFFKTREAFEQMIEEGALIEYACYVGNYYGTPKGYVEEMLSKGRDVILEIEIQGALKIKERFPESLLIFVTPPSGAELKARLERRGTESAEVIARRLSRAYEEAEGIEAYDYVVVNDSLDACVEELEQLVAAARRAPVRCGAWIREIREELKGFVKGEK